MKKIVSILLSSLLLLSPLAYASDPQDRFFVINTFDKGLNSHVSLYNTPANSGSVMQNVRVNKTYSAMAKRDTLLSYGDTGSSAVTGLHRYYKSDNTSKLISASGTVLAYGTDSTGTFTTIAQGLSDGKRWQFVTYKDVVIGTNGYEQPLKWDGLTTTTADTTGCRTAGDLCAELGAPFAELITGTTQTASKWYQYKVAFYDGTTYSYSTARSNPILTGANVHSIKLTGIPIGPTGTTHRYIYRSQANSSRTNCLADTTYKEVADLANNTTLTWTDTVADGAETNSPTWATVSAGNNATPPKGTIATIHQEKLFMSGNTTYPSDIYWSDNFNPDYFDITCYEQVRPDDGDKITFLKTFLSVLTVGKTNSIQKFYTDGSAETDWYISNPFSFIGSPAPYSVATTPMGIVYLARHGIYLFDGQTSKLISDAVTYEIEDISQTNILNTVGIYHNNEYRLSYTSTESGGTYNNRVLMYDFVRDAYVVDTENVNCWTTFSSGSDIGTLYSGSSTTDGYVVSHASSSSLQAVKYKSDLDAGTFSGSNTFGTEYDPVLSTITLDNMESYTTNALARAAWVSSETTAGKKIPPDLGIGTDGSKTVSADETLTNTVYNYTDLTVDAGKVLTVPTGCSVKVLGTTTINGTIVCYGSMNLYAHTITIGAAGKIIGGLTLRCNTINNSGTITGDIVQIGTLAESANAACRDNDFSTTAVSVTGQSGSYTAEIDFPSCSIGYLRYAMQTVSYLYDGNAEGFAYLYLNIGGSWTQLQSSHATSGSSNTMSTIDNTYNTGWSNVTGIKITGSVSGYDTSTALSACKEMQAIISIPVVDYLAGTVGTVYPTPAAVATTDYVYALDVFSENAQVNVGDYSLKMVVPPGADTLNESFSKTITAVDLSSVNIITLDVYALRDGTQMQIGIGEAAMTENLINIPVATSNTWETVSIDISGIAAASRNAITKIGIKFTNTDTGNVVYIDNIRPSITSATWTSPVYDVNSAKFDKLYWNEILNTYGNITFQMRTGATATPDGSWTAYSTAVTDPNGSDVSGVTANTYVQFQINLTTTNALYPPSLYQTDGYVFKLIYSKIGNNYETSVMSIYQTGWTDFAVPGYMKKIKRIKIHYKGETGTLAVNYKNDGGDVDKTFNIDMSVNPDDSTSDLYTGKNEEKIYTFTPPMNTETDPSAIGQYWRFTISNSGITAFQVNKIEVIYGVEERYE